MAKTCKSGFHRPRCTSLQNPRSSSTLASIGTIWQIGQGAGCAQYDSNGKLTATGTNCGTGSGGGQLLAIYSTSTPGSNVSVNFSGTANSAPSFSAGTLTLPSNTSYIETEVWGAGGGGSGGNSGGTGGTGGQTCFSNSSTSTACSGTTGPIVSANGGAGAGGGFAGSGGNATNGDVNITGGAGAGASVLSSATHTLVGGGAGGSGGGGGGGGGAANYFSQVGN